MIFDFLNSSRTKFCQCVHPTDFVKKLAYFALYLSIYLTMQKQISEALKASLLPNFQYFYVLFQFRKVYSTFFHIKASIRQKIPRIDMKSPKRCNTHCFVPFYRIFIIHLEKALITKIIKNHQQPSQLKGLGECRVKNAVSRG